MWTPDDFVHAWHFAARAHGDQQVPGSGFPYLAHLGLVFSEIAFAVRAEKGRDEALALNCALLHDVLEDTSTQAATVAAEFGPEVLAGVQALTKNDALPKNERMLDSIARIQKQPKEVWMVKLADRTANMLPPPAHWTAEKKLSYRAEAAQILEALGPASPILSGRLAVRIAAYPA